jgi:hypothetical protein
MKSTQGKLLIPGVKYTRKNQMAMLASGLTHSINTAFQSIWGPSLGGNGTWIKRSDHAPKSGCVDMFNICPKKAVLRIFVMFDLLPFFPHNYGNVCG